jgi:3-hydroxyacyl-[acyl-carrier-protein] dehydratase
MRFHLVDRLLDYSPGKLVRACKLTSRAEDCWEEDGDGLVMQPWLVFEALCQAGSWLLVITTNRRKRGALLSLRAVELHGAVRPGDVLDIRGTVESMTEEAAVFSGTVAVGDRLILEARGILCALVPAEDLEDLDDTAHMQRMLTRAERVAS